MTIDLQALLDVGFEIAKLAPGREPDATTRLYYNKTTLAGTTLPSPSANVAVRKDGVFAIRYCDPPQGSSESIEDTMQYKTLKAAGSLIIHSPALLIAAFKCGYPDLVVDGLIGGGPLAGCRLTTRGFIIQGSVDIGARSFGMQSEGALKRPTEELSAILYQSGLYRDGSKWSA